MNRKHQGQSLRHQGAQSQNRGLRAGQSSQTSSQYGKNYGQSFEQDQDYEGMNLGSRQGQGANFSDYNEDSFESSRPSYRDTDYDLDGSTYGNTSRPQRSQNLRNSSYGSYGDYETNDRNRQPSRFSSLDEDRFSEGRFNERNASSSERFGYPSSMNSWTDADRYSGSSRSSGRTGQPQFNSWGSNDQSYGQSYGEGSLANSSTHSYGSSQESERGFFGKGPKGYKRSDDRIKEDVCETLARSPRVDASDIEVNVEEACVTLSGTVDSREAKRAAEMIIENLSGVDDVKNEIKVKRQGDTARDTDSIHASSSGAKASGSLNSSTSRKSSSSL